MPRCRAHGGCVDGKGSAGYTALMAEDEASEVKAVTAGKAPALNRQIKVWQSQHRDSVFSDLFGDKRRLLQLYRALHPEDESAHEVDISNVTMKNILMVDLYNDLGFTVRASLLNCVSKSTNS